MNQSLFRKHSLLKYDAFGSIEKGYYCENGREILAIRRLYTTNIWLRPLAKFLVRNEKKALKKLEVLKLTDQLPTLLREHPDFHIRSYLECVRIYESHDPLTENFFREAKKLIRKMRRIGIAHNDLEKEANWLVNEEVRPVLTDFQLALCFNNKRGKLYLNLCREDLRHLLKHKEKYSKTTYQERSMLSKKTLITRIWMGTLKKLQHHFTRKILVWKDRVGPEERNF